jgi:hypothetical protein
MGFYLPVTTRLLVIVGLICLAISGCTATTTGAALPAAPIPPTTAESLPALLLSAPEVAAALDGDELTITSDVSRMWNDSHMSTDGGRADAAGCLAIVGAAQQGVYADSGWTGMHGQVLREPPTAPKWSHYTVQAVVLFPTAAAAVDFFTKSQSSWAGCSERELTYPQAPAPEQLWSVGPSRTSLGVLTVSRTQRGPQRWFCQRALTVRASVAVDVEACSLDAPTSAAAAIASMIGERLPTA